MSEHLVKVTHFYRTFLPETKGGLEEAIRQICLTSEDFGVVSQVVAVSAVCQNPREIELDGIPVLQVPLFASIGNCEIFLRGHDRVKAWLDSSDVINYHFPWPFADWIHLRTDPAARTIVTYHSDIVRQKVLMKIYRPVMNRFLSSVDKIVATSDNYVESSTVLKRYSNKVVSIPLGIAQQSYPEPGSDRVTHWREKFGTEFFLSVGVLRYYKGLDYLLEAAQNIDASIVICGKGPEAETLRSKALQLGLTNVHFLGFVSDEDKVALMECCRAVVFPSHLRSEAFGVTLLEASMMGKPMISCEIGTGTSFVNQHNETGLVIAPEDSRALAEAMRVLLGDAAKAKQMGAAARRRYTELFTGEIMGRNYAELYRELVNQSQPTD